MNKTTKCNILGMAVYFFIAVLFGGGYALIAMIVHEDNDRCHYNSGKFEKGDIIRGCVAVAVGTAVRYLVKGGGEWIV